MSEIPEPPDWSLLPHFPHDFFGLDANFDRKDLKRSYNRLLRQFKPEKFPAEFQRIRAAYEQLDNQLRYGTQLANDRSSQYRWQTDAATIDLNSTSDLSETRTRFPKSRSEGQAANSETAPTQDFVPLHARIQREPIGEVYRQLAEKKDKSPYEFYTLAVMSDVVERKDGLQFARWILQGLQRHTEEPGLFSLLYEYFRGPIPPSALANLLIATSKVVPNDRFFSLTEPLWKQLLRTKPFPTFRSTLETCTGNLRDLNIDSRLAFSIEILKSALWRADLEWIDATMAFIEENFERIPGQLEFEIDLLEMLRKYVAGRAAFVSAHPLRQAIDQALCNYFSEDQLAGDQAILDCQIRIARDPNMLLEAFPFQNGEDYEHFYLVWMAVVQDVCDRNVETPAEEPDNSHWVSRAHALLQRIEQVTYSSAIGKTWKLNSLGYVVGSVLVYLTVTFVLCVILTMLTLSLSQGSVVFVLLGAIGGGFMLCFWFHKRLVAPAWARYCSKKEVQCYNKLWRIEMVEFLQRSQLSFFELRNLLYCCDITGLNTANPAVGFYQQDYTLLMFSSAQRFLI